MSAIPAVDLSARSRVFGPLEHAIKQHGPDVAAQRLADLRSFLEADLAGIEHDLEAIELGRELEKDRPGQLTSTRTARSARHLLALGGKRLRPMCVALASRVGTGFSAHARDLAVAAELVHSATLLHDDVVDVGDRRRGAPTARVVYGNAASIFAGDWALVEALMRVRRTGMLDVLDRALAVLAEMLAAEALQLDRRGRIDANLDDYLQIVRGKTASLFRWSLFAGARAGGLEPHACTHLERFGEELGLAFQITDDALDLDGDPRETGKELFGDLREGKLTYPLLWAFEQNPALRDRMQEMLADGQQKDDQAAINMHKELLDLGAMEETRRYSEALIARARGCLLEVGRDAAHTPALRALETVASTVAARRK